MKSNFLDIDRQFCRADIMDQYYSEKLTAKRLKRCYKIAQPRVKQYLKAEIIHVLTKLRSTDTILELGCGYGRVIRYLCPHVKALVGIDTSMSSLKMAYNELRPAANYCLCRMDAAVLGFRDDTFDKTICIQNGISAIKADQLTLINEAIRVTRPGGKLYFSSYCEKFWDERLEWFCAQAKKGLLGEIDYDKTGDGTIICKDGFKATTVSPQQFESLAEQAGKSAKIREVDGSSLFCEITV